MNDARALRSAERLAPLGLAVPTFPAIDDGAIVLRPVRDIVVRALCHGMIAQFAAGLDRESAAIQIEEWSLEGALDEDERALWCSGVEDGQSIPHLSIPLGYAEEASFALMWLLGMADRLPAFDGTQASYMDVETDLRCRLLDPNGSPDEMIARAAPRPRAEIADEIDYLARYQAIYERESPGWTMGGSGPWLGPIGPEGVAMRLRALLWAAHGAEGR